MVWAALILAQATEHKYAIAELRRILKFVEEAADRAEFHDLTLSGISKLTPERRERVIRHMLESSMSRKLFVLLSFSILFLPTINGSDLVAPSYISIDSIEKIAGEDTWEEYVPMNLGHWAGVDLRKMSEGVGLKDLYDQYYSWPSGFVHTSWGAVREACFKTCVNPLHRLHRVPHRGQLVDAVSDAASLVDQILSEIDDAYPSFKNRLVSVVTGV